MVELINCTKYGSHVFPTIEVRESAYIEHPILLKVTLFSQLKPFFIFLWNKASRWYFFDLSGFNDTWRQMKLCHINNIM